MAETVSDTTKTFTNMIDEVRFLTSTKDGTLFPDSQVKVAINNGLSIVFSAAHDERSEIYADTITGQRDYEIPEAKTLDFNGVIDRVLIDDEEIDEVAYTEDDGEQGEPTEYYVNGKTITLMPTPDAQYEIRVIYRHDFVPLVNSGDTTNMSDTEIHAALLYACYLLKLKDEQWTAASMFLNQHEAALKNATRIKPGIYVQDASGDIYGGSV